MDEHNVHHFWGISPAIDLGGIATRPSSKFDGSGPINILQVAPCDARHTLLTLSRLGRHIDSHSGPLNIHVYEEDPEGLARHILLLSVILDGSLPAKERAETLLEIHGNAFVREKTAAYLDQRGRVLESLLVALFSGEPADSHEVVKLGADIACIANALDISLLKYQERDAIIDALHKYRSSVDYDMAKAWDARCRKWYGDRFDFKRNMIDWDYLMRLLTTGTPGQDLTLGSIIHFHHFRHWRSHGVAYELRDSAYSHPNRSLLSKAYGRTKEFKDRSLKDVGRSVSAWGFWGDILNSPFHAWGVASEDPSLFASSNKQFSRTAVDVAEHNILALLHELRTGERYAPTNGAHRAKVARGPTTMEDLEHEATADAKDKPASEPLKSAGDCLSADELNTRVDVVGPSQPVGKGSASQCKEDEFGNTSVTHNQDPAYIPCCSFKGRKHGYIFKTGPEGQGYYADGNQPACLIPCEPEVSHLPSCCRIGPETECQIEEERLRNEEAQLDAAAWALTSSGLKLVLASGDIVKNLTGRSKFKGIFDVVSLGCRHLHLAGPDYLLDKASKTSGLLVIERAQYLLQLNKEQFSSFEDKMTDIVASAGWQRAQSSDVVGAFDKSHSHDAHAVFKRIS